jgi:hypothetical protein
MFTDPNENLMSWDLQSSASSSFFFFVVLGLELKAFTLSHSASPIFVKGFLR